MAHLRELLLAGSLIVGAAAGTVPASASQYVQPGLRHGICPREPVGYSTCFVRVLGSGSPNGAADAASGNLEGNLASPQNSAPSGLPPSAITTAYGFPTTGGSGETIAVVDAFDDPTVASNLTTFSNEYGLPACTVTDGCLTKVNQSGGTSYPTVTSGWALEISLDVEWAHALAPKARVLLVEATSASDANLFDAVTYAAQHAQYVSMSWGGTEFRGETTYDADLQATPSVSFFAASGDSAKKVEYPAASPDVISVGGTTLTVTKTTYTWKSESAWSTAGGGCSAYEKPPAAQKAFPTYDQVGAECNGDRAIPDVALDANPNTGVSVYDARSISTGRSGWLTVGGTSAATVMWAARSAATGVHANSTYVYADNIPFYNVTTGSNGEPCEKGYNLCTGLGSWNQTNGTINATLSFGTAPQSIVAGEPSGAMTVALSEPSPSGGLSVSVSTSSPAGGFSTTSTGAISPTLNVTVPSGSTTSAPFYYEDTKAGDPVLTASASYMSSVTQSETVDAGPLARITVSPSSATLVEGASETLVATGVDQFTNQVVAGFAPTWSTTLGGSFAIAKGASTSFTAAYSAASGAVTASQTGVRGTVPVTVRALSQPVAVVNSSTWMNVFYDNESGDLVNGWWQSASGWQDQVLATGMVGSPAAVVNSPTWMDVFYASASGDLMNAWWQSASGWHDQSLATGIAGSPVAVARNATSMNVFYRGTNGDLMGASWQPSTGWQVQSLASGDAGTPTVVANSATWLDVFYRSTTGSLMNAWWQSASGWHDQSLASGDAGTPTVVVNSSTWMDVFYRSTTDQLMNAWWQSASGWHDQALASGDAGTPSAVVNSSTWMDVFYRSTTGELMNAWWQLASGWHDQALASGDDGTPTVVLNSSTWMDVFYQSTSGGLMNAWWQSASGWHDQELASGVAGPPAAVANSPTWMDVFDQASTGGLMNAWWQSASGWHVQTLF